ncbi:MAG: heavy-metal-associated domain-containing protein [Bellilinea sp.]
MEDPCRELAPVEKLPKIEEQVLTERLYLSIAGMNCGNCANRVRNALLSTYGVTSVIVAHVDGLAEVIYNPGLVNPDKLINSVRAAGGDGVHNYDAAVLAQEP